MPRGSRTKEICLVYSGAQRTEIFNYFVFFFPFEKVDLNVPVCVKLINNGTTGSYQVTLPLP